MLNILRFYNKILIFFLLFSFFPHFLFAQDTTPPEVKVEANPKEVLESWQNTQASAFVLCKDDESGCDKDSFKLKTFDKEITQCPKNYEEYLFCDQKPCTKENPLLVSSHLWICAAAKDKKGNIGFSDPFEFKIDLEFPEGEILAPKASKIGENFSIEISGKDNNQIDLLCYKEENDIDWTCSRCFEKECQATFERKELSLKKYTYFGFLKDIAQNVSFTDPESVSVSIQDNPKVATFSAIYQGDKAVLKGYLISLGGADEVEVYFEYGEDKNYGKESNHLKVKKGGVFSIQIYDLLPEKIYHFRAVAKNDVGISFGEDLLTTELLENGDFETQSLTSWKEFEKDFGQRKASDEEVKNGKYSALIGFKEGKIGKDKESGIYQEVTLPSNANKIIISFWYKFFTLDKCDYDFLKIYLLDEKDNILKTYLEYCCPNCSGLNTYGWKKIEDEITKFAGKKVKIYFSVENRSDKFRRSWAFIDQVSIYFFPGIPPKVKTLQATGIETNKAILNGELLDLGNASVVEVYFEWGETENYGKKTESLFLKTPGGFSITLGNLNPGTKYYFRAVAKSNGGTGYGSQNFFVTLYSAAGGWIWSPRGYHEDPSNDWGSGYFGTWEDMAHDGDLQTRCQCRAGYGWKGFLIFKLPYPIRSNKIRIAGTGIGSASGGPLMDIDVLYKGASSWTDLWYDRLPVNHQFVEIPLPYEGEIVAGRVRFFNYTSDWSHSISEFQFYKVPDEPITPPANLTLEASSVEEDSAILHGMVTNDGRALCQFRFEYDTYENYLKTGELSQKTSWEGSLASGERFSKLITGLKEGVKYAFRAQVKNSAGVSSGAIKTFTPTSAPSGWVLPRGAYDSSWERVPYAFDDLLETSARVYKKTSETWLPWIYLTRKEISSDKIRFYARGETGSTGDVDRVRIEIFKDGRWEFIYEGPFQDRTWKEIKFSPGKVSQARIRFRMKYSNHYFYAELFEFNFWKIAQKPSVLSVLTEPGDIGTNRAKIKGKLTDLGGASEAQVWFVWDTVSRSNPNDYRFSTPKQRLTSPQNFEYLLTGLAPYTTYYFRAVASNVAGVSFGEERTFTTLGSCVPGQTKTCISEQGCQHTLTCPSSGYWPPCPRDECPKGTQNCSFCPCPTPPPGYEAPEYGNCDQNCECQIGTGPGEPCEFKLKVKPPNPPSSLYEIWDDCKVPGISLPTFYWTYSHPEGRSQNRFEIKIFGETTLDVTFSGSSPRYYPPSDWVKNNLLFGKKYSWQVRVQDDQGNWSDWSSIKEFETRKHQAPQVDFEWSPQVPSLKEKISFLDKSEVFGGATKSSFEWTFPSGYKCLNPSSNCHLAQNPEILFESAPIANKITLKVTDSDGLSCSKTKEISFTFPLPLWREVLPRF
jgi:hypothetical protein